MSDDLDVFADGQADRSAGDGDDDSPFDGVRSLAGFGTSLGRRTTEYLVRSSIRTGTRLVRIAATSKSLAELIDESRDVAVDELQRLGVEVDELQRLGVEVGELEPNGDDDGRPDRWQGGQLPEADAQRDLPTTESELQAYGQRLLDQSADVGYKERVHPTYPLIIAQISPDEARILRLLATDGPQPSVDVRDAGWLPIGSTLVGAGLTMVGDDAGCSHTARTSMYLSNLQRLGLIWFSDEPVEDLKRYQLLEAQPSVVDARSGARRPRLLRRSIHLTPLGVDFCDVCMPFEVAPEAAGAYDDHVDLAE